jgi:hypothetical protein
MWRQPTDIDPSAILAVDIPRQLADEVMRLMIGEEGKGCFHEAKILNRVLGSFGSEAVREGAEDFNYFHISPFPDEEDIKVIFDYF